MWNWKYVFGTLGPMNFKTAVHEVLSPWFSVIGVPTVFPNSAEFGVSKAYFPAECLGFVLSNTEGVGLLELEARVLPLGPVADINRFSEWSAILSSREIEVATGAEVAPLALIEVGHWPTLDEWRKALSTLRERLDKWRGPIELAVNSGRLLPMPPLTMKDRLTCAQALTGSSATEAIMAWERLKLHEGGLLVGIDPIESGTSLQKREDAAKEVLRRFNLRLDS